MRAGPKKRRAPSTGSALLFIVLMSYCVLTPLHSRAQEGGDSEDKSKERLIRKIQGQEEDDVMARIIRHMTETRRRLSDLFDVGPETQQIQQDIIKELDLAIKQAGQNLRRITTSGEQKGDKRKASQGTDNAESDSDAGESTESSEAGDDGGGDDIEAAKGGALREHKRRWGTLPERDREEILQGVNEEVHEKYREQADRYYEALAQPEEEE